VRSWCLLVRPVADPSRHSHFDRIALAASVRHVASFSCDVIRLLSNIDTAPHLTANLIAVPVTRAEG
jgi:hypothetical protein